MAMTHVYPTPRMLQAVDLNLPAALVALLESHRLTDAERPLYTGFALRRLESAREELQRLAKAGMKPAPG